MKLQSTQSSRDLKNSTPQYSIKHVTQYSLPLAGPKQLNHLTDDGPSPRLLVAILATMLFWLADSSCELIAAHAGYSITVLLGVLVLDILICGVSSAVLTTYLLRTSSTHSAGDAFLALTVAWLAQVPLAIIEKGALCPGKLQFLLLATPAVIICWGLASAISSRQPEFIPVQSGSPRSY